MKRFLLATVLSASAMPAMAGGLAFDLPRLTFPESPPVGSAQTCLNPTSVTQACPDK